LSSSEFTSGQPKTEKGKSPLLNQVSKTSLSCLTLILFISSTFHFFFAFSFASSSLLAAIQSLLLDGSG
jgi:hypothetical protein